MCADFELFLKEKSLTHEQVDKALSEVKVLPPREDERVHIKLSAIHGKGVFVNDATVTGDCLGSAMINGTWTIAGRFMNHSLNPNVFISGDGWNMCLTAAQPIEAGTELTANYRNVGKVIKL